MAGEGAGDRRGKKPQPRSPRGVGAPDSWLRGAEPGTAAHRPAGQRRAGLREIGEALSPRGISHTIRSRLETELGPGLPPLKMKKLVFKVIQFRKPNVRSKLLEGVWTLALETTELSSTPDFAA